MAPAKMQSDNNEKNKQVQSVRKNVRGPAKMITKSAANSDKPQVLKKSKLEEFGLKRHNYRASSTTESKWAAYAPGFHLSEKDRLNDKSDQFEK